MTKKSEPDLHHLTVIGRSGTQGLPFLNITRNCRSVNTHQGDINLMDFSRKQIVLFTGGEDVHPSFYRHKSVCSRNVYNHPRDRRELRLYSEIVHNKLPVVGICRGAQLLNVANGGALIQDVANHSKAHYIATSKMDRFKVSSTHHQMMVPGPGAELLAWAAGESGDYLYDTDVIKEDPLERIHKNAALHKEPEVIYYKKTNTLCIQYHPEYMNPEDRGVAYYNDLINDLLLR